MTCEFLGAMPIDLVEPCPARVEGDRLPCHLFMPEVAWPVPVGEVIRMRPRRDHWLQPPLVRWQPLGVNDGDMPEPPGFGRALAIFGAVWVLGAVCIVWLAGALPSV